MLGKGLAYEKIALTHLQNSGLRKIETNFHSKFGEIDLIMLDQNVLAFVEVRFRKNSRYGSAAESVTLSKQKKIIKCAEYYLTKKRYWHLATRFDVVAISPKEEPSTDKHHIIWHKSAFVC
mgnify:CR=1 FL=1